MRDPQFAENSLALFTRASRFISDGIQQLSGHFLASGIMTTYINVVMGCSCHGLSTVFKNQMKTAQISMPGKATFRDICRLKLAWHANITKQNSAETGFSHAAVQRFLTALCGTLVVLPCAYILKFHGLCFLLPLPLFCPSNARLNGTGGVWQRPPLLSWNLLI